jgi:N-acetylmuramoyl-L-alanine amidase
MATQYTWGKFKNDVAPSQDGLTNVIVQIHYNKTAVSDDGIEVYYYGAFGTEAPDEAAFIPYEEVTIQDRIDWTNARFESEGRSIDEILDTMIEEKRTPKVISDYPIPEEN